MDNDPKATVDETNAAPAASKTAKLRRLTPLLLVLLAFGLSFGIVRRHEMANISPCAVNFVCNDTIDRQRGNYQKIQYGFPVTYRATETFKCIPNDKTSYGSTLREFQPFNPVFAAMNVLFWSTLLFYVWRALSRLGRKRSGSDAA